MRGPEDIHPLSWDDLPDMRRQAAGRAGRSAREEGLHGQGQGEEQEDEGAVEPRHLEERDRDAAEAAVRLTRRAAGATKLSAFLLI